MSKFSKKAGANELRISSIIDAAEIVILKKGYEDATFTDFAEAANYNKRTIYLYFQSKDDIFAAVTYRLFEKIETAVRKKINPKQNGYTNLINIAWAYYNFFVENPKYFNLLWVLENKFFVPNKEEHYSPHILKSFEKRKIAVKLIYETYEKGIADGSIKASKDTNLMLPLLWSQTLGVLQVISRSTQYLAEELKINHKRLFELHVEKVAEILVNG